MIPQDQLSQLKLAADAELNLLVVKKINQNNATNGVARQGWFARWFVRTETPTYVQLWNRIHAAELEAIDDNAIRRSIFRDRISLVNELNAINGQSESFERTREVIGLIQHLYAQINADGVIPILPHHHIRAGGENLLTPVAHLNALEQARNILTDDHQKLQLLKRKIWFAQEELQGENVQDRDRIQAILDADLQSMFDIIQINNGVHRVNAIIGNWTAEPLFTPVVARDLEAEVVDVYTPFRGMFTQEQQHQLNVSFRQSCINALKQHIGNDQNRQFSFAQLETRRKFLEELYYQQCALESIQREHDSIHDIDSDEDTSSYAASSTDPLSPNRQDVVPINGESFVTLESLHRIRGQMKAMALREENVDRAILNRLKAPVVEPVRLISPSEEAHLKQIECDAEITMLRRLDPKGSQSILNARRDEEIQAIRAQIAEAEKEWLASQSTVSSMASIAFPSLSDRSDPARKLEELNGMLIEKMKEHKGEQLWKVTDWGKILLVGKNTTGFLGFLSNDFETQIDQISSKIRELEASYNIALISRTESLSGALPKPVAASSNTPAQQSIEQITHQINQEKINLLGAFLQRVIDKLGEYAQEEIERRKNGTLTDVRSGQLQQRKQTLNQAYRLLLDQYRLIPRPQKTLTDFAREEALDCVTMGFYSAKTYIKPEEFDTQKKFAEVGYSIQRGMAEWNKFTGETPQEIMTTLVGRFLVWADKHPKDAVRLASDVLLTISMLQDEGLVRTLSRQVNAKISISVQLGTLGREEETPFTEEDVWVITFARLARFGPQATAAAHAMKTAGEELFRGNILGALWSGVRTYAGERYQGTAIQRIVENSSLNELQMMKVALDLAQGYSMQEIVQAQAAIEMTRAVGNLRRTFLAPGEVMKSAMKWLADPFREVYRASGGFAERITRLSLMTVTHIPSTGYVASIVLGGTGLSVSGVMLGSLAVLVTAVFMHAVYTRYINPVLNTVWKETRQRIRRMELQRIAEANRLNVIERNALYYFEELQKLRVIPSAPPRSQEQLSLFDLTKRRMNQVRERITNALVEKFITRLNERSRSPKSSADYVKTYVETLNREALERKINKQKAMKNLPAQMRPEVVERVIHAVKYELAITWLRIRLSEAAEREFIEAYESFSKITDLDELDQKVIDKEASLNTKKETAVGRITDDMTRDANLDHEEKKKVKERVLTIVD